MKNISEYGDTDIFPYPFETFIFKDKTKKIIEDIKTLDKEFAGRIAESKNVWPNLGDEFYPQNISTVSPSGNIGFRWVTQIEPIWNVYYLWLVLSIAAEILLILSEEIEKTSIIFKSKTELIDFLKKKLGKTQQLNIRK